MAKRRELLIASLAIVGIAVHLVLRFLTDWSGISRDIPLLVVLTVGGIPLVITLLGKLWRWEFGSDLLAGISIVTAVLLGEYLAGSIVVLMLSGGETLERLAQERASTALQALANRMPAFAHRLREGQLQDITLSEVRIGDQLTIFPHEICPVDGTVHSGHGSMDEAYLTGEPFLISKAPGAAVLSGAINGEQALTIIAEKLPVDSRYARIMEVMRTSQQQRSHLKRLGDYLGAYYTPLALGLALLAWMISGESQRFLAVLVVATPCPLLIAIPVAIVGTISQAAQRGIVIRDPSVLELIDTCQTAIFDKTGTLTYGRPELVRVWTTNVTEAETFSPDFALQLAAGLERFSKHPLSSAIQTAADAKQLPKLDADSVSEKPGAGLSGTVAGHHLWLTSRKHALRQIPSLRDSLPAPSPGLECALVVDDQQLALLQFRDEPRQEGREFIRHLPGQHGIRRVMLVSGDREVEVEYLAQQVGIDEILASQSPEQKLQVVRAETARSRTLFLGDGINDAPAMSAATVGIAFGHSNEVAAEAAGAVIMDSSLQKLDEFLHLGHRMKRIILQSAIGGMALSGIGMLAAALGYLPPVAGAIAQEVIDVVAVLNALRAAFGPSHRSDIHDRHGT